jgi:hypothetical protein
MMKCRNSTACVLLVLLLAGCGGGSGSDEFESFTFTADDAAEIADLLDQIEEEQKREQGEEIPVEEVIDVGGTSSEGEEIVLDVTQQHMFNVLRSGVAAAGENLFRVTNVFLNVRAKPNVRSEKVAELQKGDALTLLDFPNAGWAHIALPDERTGYVSSTYIAQIVTEQQLAEVKAQYEGQYYVDFQFLNVRTGPTSQSQKIGELTRDQIITPIAFHDDWARIAYEGQEGFVSAEYLEPFSPSFVVRQDSFSVPILHYRADEPAIADVLVKHLALLRSANRNTLTLKDFYDLLLQQEERDLRFPGDGVILAISDLTPATVKDVADALRASGVHATFFVRSSEVGPDGISTELLKSMVRAGNDIQSAGHTAEDLRAETNNAVVASLSQSRQIIEDVTSSDVFAVSYPSGGVNERIADQARKAGYLFGLTLNPSVDGVFSRSEFLMLPSTVITPATTDEELKVVVGIE